MVDQDKLVHIRYFALLREERGVGNESVRTCSQTARQLFDELSQEHRFSLGYDRLNVAVNEEFANWDTQLNNEDTVVFIPPVAGG
jgi:sulfur-carrier protein